MPSGEGCKKESVSARALDNIMKLLTSQITLERRSRDMEVRFQIVGVGGCIN